MKITFRCPAEMRDYLPKPYPAKRGIPDWYKKMPMSAYSDDLEADVQMLKQCLPFLDAMSYGFISASRHTQRNTTAYMCVSSIRL